MSWTVFLDDDNTITYTLDAKKISITQRVDGQKLPTRVKENDLTGNADAATSWVVVMNLEKNGVTAGKQDGTAIDSATDDKHDWSHARISVKGDNYFTVWTGR